MGNIIVYADGACKGNPGPGGYGAVIVYPNDCKKEVSAGFAKTTNSRMELMAVQMALQSIWSSSQLRTGNNITVISDSKYVVDSVKKRWIWKWAANGWVNSTGKPVANVDLWKSIALLIGRFDDFGVFVSFEWIRGHGDNEHHRTCDKLASNAATCQSCFCEREVL